MTSVLSSFISPESDVDLNRFAYSMHSSKSTDFCVINGCVGWGCVVYGSVVSADVVSGAGVSVGTERLLRLATEL